MNNGQDFVEEEREIVLSYVAVVNNFNMKNLKGIFEKKMQL